MSTAPQPLPPATVPVAGGSMTVDHRPGQQPTVLFLHYWGGAARTWDGVRDHLTGQATTAWDQRGWGEQATLPGPFDLDSLAADVESVVAELDIGQVVVVGRSQGGKVAQILGRRAPRWLRGLVLVAPAPPTPPDWITADFCEALSHSYDTPESALAGLETAMAAQLPQAVLERAIHDSTSAGSVAARTEFPLRGIATDLGPRTIEVPTIVLSGEHDKVEPAHMLEQLLMPTLDGLSAMRMVPGAGHILPLKAPEAIADAVESVLADLS